uniref:Uncharacterized protein n=1 Tax=Spermophilus dauricus TaxID=99837 RepID=A0A8C9Q6F5_SPEDA
MCGHLTKCCPLRRLFLVLPPKTSTESLRPQQLLGFLARTRTPGCRRSLRIGGWRPPGSGLLSAHRELRRGDRGGYAAGRPRKGAREPARQPAAAAGLAPPGDARWPPTGRHYSPPLSLDPPVSSEQPTRLRHRHSEGAYKQAQEPRLAPRCASASPAALRSCRPP